MAVRIMKMELVPYSESARNALEDTPIKRELLERSGDGITVRAFWQKVGNICTIFLRDERTSSACEFVVPNDEVMVWFKHPFAHPQANTMPTYEQRRNSE